MTGRSRDGNGLWLRLRCRSFAGLTAAFVAVLWTATLRAQESAARQPESDRGTAEQSATKQSPEVLEDYQPKSVGELLPRTAIDKVSLDRILETARESAPAVERAKAKLLRGEARVEGTDVLTKYNPVVKAGVERFPLGAFSFGEAKAGLFQRFTTAGEQAARLEAAIQRREVLEKRLARTRWAVHVDVHRLYHLALVDLRKLQLRVRLRAFFEDLLQVAETRLGAGEATEIAVQLSRVELARAKQGVIRARSALVSRLRTLEERVGFETESLSVPAGSLPEVRVDLDADRMQEVARESHPLVGVYEALVEKADAEVRYQRKKGWPDPGVGLFFKNRSPNAGPPTNGVVAQLSVPIPIWNANKLGRFVSAKQRTVAKTELETLREKLGPKVDDAVQSVRAAARQIDVYGKKVVPAFEKELKLLREGYRAGEFDITDVTVAQERLLRAREQALDAMDDYFEAAARLERLTGEEHWKSDEKPSDNQGRHP